MREEPKIQKGEREVNTVVILASLLFQGKKDKRWLNQPLQLEQLLSKSCHEINNAM